MTWSEFICYYVLLLAGMLVCRCAPMFFLKGRRLSERTERILSLIPSAAFAALVANDLFDPAMLESGLAQASIPLVAAFVVAIVAKRSKSLVISVLVGVAAYAVLTFLV